MDSSFTKLLNNFNSGKDFVNAIVSNNPLVFSALSGLVIFRSTVYQNIRTSEGGPAARQILTEALVVFRRQIKHQKIEIEIGKEKILANKCELARYLDQLLSLICDIRKYDRTFGHPHEFEMKLINGQGYQEILKLKGAIVHSLAGFGCKNGEDREEIFNESLIVFWQKLINRQIGLYFVGEDNQPEKYHVYNREFYQNSKLSTYLTGIAKNTFLNRIKNEKSHPEISSEITETALRDPEIPLSENPVFFMFIYYRIFEEPRKLRAMISLLQYDCGLEDKEVKQLIGISNARIHSYRLRRNFHEWYNKHVDHAHLFLDKAALYLAERELKADKLNQKIRYVHAYQKPSFTPAHLEVFREEFRSFHDFSRYCAIFRHLLYLSTAGKTSSLAGLPDETRLRGMMALYRDGLFKLQGHQTLIFLFYYGSDEPENSIVDLLKSLCPELTEMDHNLPGLRQLASLLSANRPKDAADLSNKIFGINRTIFEYFSNQKEFLNLIGKNEPRPRPI